MTGSAPRVAISSPDSINSLSDGIASASQYSIGGSTYYTGSNSGSVSPTKEMESSDLHDSQFYDLDIDIYYHERKHNYSTTSLRKKIVSKHICRETKTR